jgi:phosphatidate phosphatase APP1
MKKLLSRFLYKLEAIYDRWKYRKLGNRPVRIQPFRGYGTPSELFFQGRVLEDLPVGPARPEDSLWKILLDSIKRFESDEVPFARLKVSVHDTVVEVRANDEGYFQAWFKLPDPVRLEAGQQCLSASVELLEPLCPGHAPLQVEAQVCIPQRGCRFGVISDIDDTIVQTNVLTPWKLILTLFFRSALTRRSYPGMAAFYRGLWRFQPGEPVNPFFYISASPWNLYDLLEEYMSYQKFPPDPVMVLRDWGISQHEILPTDHNKHKLGFIRLILQMYSNLNFILIGDSGQQDPEIYTRLVERYSHRILAIYIREVTRRPERIAEIERLRERISLKEVPLILAENTLQMAEHAAAQGWISPQALVEVRAATDQKK